MKRVSRQPTPADRLDRSGRPSRFELLVLGCAMILHVAVQAVYHDWIIEDAAICFAYARNLASGEGLVAMAGGERVEGYSDPLWVAILAVFAAMGFNLYWVAKLLGGLFGAATLPLTLALAREALPEDSQGLRPLLAPLLLAGSAHHAIWSASGLENGLFSLLLVSGAWLLLREDRLQTAFPWSALAFFLLALTRPEGVLYGAVALVWVAGLSLRRGRGIRPILRWAALFSLPYLGFLLWRIWIFSWPLPMTYYAKLGAAAPSPWSWDGRGWWQLRTFAASTWSGWGLWLLPLAMLSSTGWRGRIAVGIIAIGGALLLLPGPEPLASSSLWPDLSMPPWYDTLKIVFLGVLGLGLPLLAIGGVPGWRARGLIWHLGAVAVFFSLASDGDWMHGLRWMSLFAPAQAILFGVGLAEGLRLLSRWTDPSSRGTVRWVAVAFAISLWYAPNATFAKEYAKNPDMRPESVRLRLDYTSAFAEAVFLDEPIVNLDMDMGAHLFWGTHRMVDMAGLVDVPMALHTYGHRDRRHRRFIEEYVFEERNPHVAHVHLRWAEYSNFESYPQWDRYFLLRGYEDGQYYHGGIWARRDLVMAPRWPHGARPLLFGGGLQIVGVHRVDPRGSAGWSTYLEVGIEAPDPPERFSMLAFLSDEDGVVASWELPLGVALQGHIQLPPTDWRPGEIFHGKFALRIPDAVPEGRYDLGLVVLGANGEVRPALQGTGWAIPPRELARFAEGEARWPAAVQVRPEDELKRQFYQHVSEATRRAEAGDCQDAEDQWRAAKLLLSGYHSGRRAQEPSLKTAFAACWTARAASSEELSEQIELLARAHPHDHRLPAYRALSEEVAARAYARGQAARAAGDWDAAYRYFSDALRITPYNAWARRYAEEARDHRMKLHDDQGWGRSFGWW